MLKSFRYILLPFSFIYGSIIWVRNKLFDKNILHAATFNFPLICVGNLAVGGTGKTPMVEYLIKDSQSLMIIQQLLILVMSPCKFIKSFRK
jgi:tetraacyldisaccharide 4'-kinase